MLPGDKFISLAVIFCAKCINHAVAFEIPMFGGNERRKQSKRASDEIALEHLRFVNFIVDVPLA